MELMREEKDNEKIMRVAELSQDQTEKKDKPLSDIDHPTEVADVEVMSCRNQNTVKYFPIFKVPKVPEGWKMSKPCQG